MTENLGRTIAIGLGIGLLGMQASSLLFRSSKQTSSELFQMLLELRDGLEIDDSKARQKLAFWGLLKDYPASAVALELSPVCDLCVRLAPYKAFDPAAYDRLVLGAAALALLQAELAYGWRKWTLAMPRFMHAASFEMLMGVRKLRQSIARSSADYLVDFDELAAEVTQLHNDTSSNALLESRARSDAEPPPRLSPLAMTR